MKRMLLLPMLIDDDLPPVKRQRIDDVPLLVETGPILCQPTEREVADVAIALLDKDDKEHRTHFLAHIVDNLKAKGYQTSSSMVSHSLASSTAKVFVLTQFKSLFSKYPSKKLINWFFPVDWHLGMVENVATAATHYGQGLTHEDHNEAIYDLIENRMRLYYLFHCQHLFLAKLSDNWGNFLNCCNWK
jgi:hypothetical protein